MPRTACLLIVLVALVALLAACRPPPPPAADTPQAPSPTPQPTPDPTQLLIDNLRQKGIAPLTNQTAIASGLAYGRDLLHNSKLDVRYYQLAINQLLLVLYSLEDNPRSQTYQDAWALLQIARDMQRNAYDNAVFSMEQNIGLLNYNDAMKDAAFAYRLYPEDSDESNRIQSRFEAIQRMQQQ
jgi:hypothetical protein